MDFRNLKDGDLVVMNNTSKQETQIPPGYIETTRQTSNLRSRWIWVEPSVWTDKMLTALENGVKGGKWFSIMDKVYKPATLRAAWQKVKANKGAAGVDKQSTERFQVNEEKYLSEIHEELRRDTYQPQAVKRVYIPKGGGKTRPLGIPTVKDRIIQTAAKMVLEPILEKEFLDVSYGFRPGRGAKDALRKVDQKLLEGYTWVVDADLQAYFDTIPHEKLMGKLQRYVSDGKYLSIVEKWLNQEIMEEASRWVPIMGTPQGAVLSPLLANLYLHDLDKAITKAGYEMVRYADDFVILCKSEQEALESLKLIEEWVTAHGLTIHPEKTHLGNCMEEGQGFDFLGYRFECGKRWIRKKSLKSFRDKIREKTKRTCGQSIQFVIETLNRTLKGWYQYFKHVNKWGMGTFDSFTRRRLRGILRKQNKRPGFGRSFRDHKEWPNSYFANLGLFSMKEARVLEVARQSR
jgi:RNA-directed DNA polymerase